MRSKAGGRDGQPAARGCAGTGRSCTVVFTVPKMLRPYFLRHRELLGELCRAAWQTVLEMMVSAAGEQIRPGMVAVIQTFGSTINFHPHIHALVSRGGWTEGGQWIAVPWVDANAAELLFRHKVFSLLRKAGLIDEERIALLLSWKHSGFSVHNSVSVQPDDAGATERLVRYLMRAPVSQERPDSRELLPASAMAGNPVRPAGEGFVRGHGRCPYGDRRHQGGHSTFLVPSAGPQCVASVRFEVRGANEEVRRSLLFIRLTQDRGFASLMEWKFRVTESDDPRGNVIQIAGRPDARPYPRLS
jgi:hypothetical protein